MLKLRGSPPWIFSIFPFLATHTYLEIGGASWRIPLGVPGEVWECLRRLWKGLGSLGEPLVRFPLTGSRKALAGRTVGATKQFFELRPVGSKVEFELVFTFLRIYLYFRGGLYYFWFFAVVGILSFMLLLFALLSISWLKWLLVLSLDFVSSALFVLWLLPFLRGTNLPLNQHDIHCIVWYCRFYIMSTIFRLGNKSCPNISQMNIMFYYI